LRKNGLDYRDIQPIFLAPADARAGLESRAIDAWAIWDPFLSAAEQQSHARLLADASGVASHHQFFLSERNFAQTQPKVVQITMEALSAEGRAVIANFPQAAAELSPIQGLPPEVIEAGLRHYAHVYKPIDANVIAEQQVIADTFASLGLIPKKIVVSEALLRSAAV
jgi:sulfonate transport system substrate-binding protein